MVEYLMRAFGLAISSTTAEWSEFVVYVGVAQPRVHVHKDDAALLPLLLQGVVDDLGLVLGAHAGERLALRLRDAELLERVLDVVRDVVPGAALVLHRADVVVDLLEVQVREVAAPLRGRLLEERLERLEPVLEHPLRLVLVLGDHGDDLRVYPLARGPEEVLLGIVESVLVLVEPKLLNALVFWHSFPFPSSAPRSRTPGAPSRSPCPRAEAQGPCRHSSLFYRPALRARGRARCSAG